MAQRSDRYTDPSYFTRLTWGSNSHWLQPWRGYLETVPAATFVDGPGVSFNVNANQAENVATMLAKYGFHHARIEVPWGSFSYDDENQFDDPLLAIKLAALKRHGIRPLLLLNSNSRQPCPMRSVRRRLAADADRGSRTVQLDRTDGLIVNYSGLSRIASVDAANIFIIAISGNTVTLSKPLPVRLAAGSAVDIATLKYRPFGAPGTDDFATTLRGWQTYVLNVARIARRALGTTGSRDGGFDLEIWNELTFGSSFLSLNNYYSPAIADIPGPAVWSQIVGATASTADAHPELFSGAQIGDGFANTVPWRASSTEPARIDAIDKHPYESKLSFPAAEQQNTHLNAGFEPDDYVPSYDAAFPEYWATGIRTDNMLRDMSPFESKFAGATHGRNARVVNGSILPVTVWITEVNNDPERDNPAVTNAEALEIKGRTTARYLAFFLNKGVTQLDFYAVEDRNEEFGDRAMSMVRNSFLEYSDRPAAPYPTDDAPYVSPALRVTGRIVSKMQIGLDRNLGHTTNLEVSSVKANTNPVIIPGDGSAAHPDLRATDLFAFLPFQSNARRFVIPYYVITQDVTKRLPEVRFDVNVTGFSPKATYTGYDPVTDKTFTINATPLAHGVGLQLPAIDYPRLLIVSGPTP